MLHGLRVGWVTGRTSLYVCHQSVRPDDRMLVVSPHPDDAELAEFGLYADTQATIVTVTAGDASDRYKGKNYGVQLTRAQVGRMLVLDRILVSTFGGVQRE